MIHFHNQYGKAYCGVTAATCGWDEMTNRMDDVTCEKCISVSPPIKAAVARGALKGASK